MNLLNQTARTKAISYFIAIYLVSILLILLLSYFLFSAPVKILTEQVNSYKDFKSQHNSLLDKTSNVTTQISELIAVEKVNSSNPDPELDSLVEQYKQRINKAIVSLKSDSAKKMLSLDLQNLTNYLAAYEAILYYLENNSSQRQVLQTPKPGDTLNELIQLRRVIVKLQIDNSRLRDLNHQLAQQKNRLVDTSKLCRSSTHEDQKIKLAFQGADNIDSCIALCVVDQTFHIKLRTDYAR